MTNHKPLTLEEREKIRAMNKLILDSGHHSIVSDLTPWVTIERCFDDLDAKDREIAALKSDVAEVDEENESLKFNYDGMRDTQRMLVKERDEARAKLAAMEGAWDPDVWIAQQRDEARADHDTAMREACEERCRANRAEERIAKLKAVAEASRRFKATQLKMFREYLRTGILSVDAEELTDALDALGADEGEK